MNLNSMRGLIQRLSRGRQSRARFVSSQLDKFIAFQIRALRDQEKMSQSDLAAALGTSQPAINRLESADKGRPTITTLKKIAAVFDVGLEVRFVPFSKLIKFESGTPYVEYGKSTSSFYVSPFEKDQIPESKYDATTIVSAIAGSIGDSLDNQLASATSKKGPQAVQSALMGEIYITEIGSNQTALGGL